MKINKTNKDDAIVVEVKATAEEVNNAFERAYISFANDIGLKHESGKTIQQAAEEQMGLKDLDSVVCDNVADALIPKAIDISKVIPVAPPKAKITSKPKRNQDYTFEFEMIEKPHYELDSYDPISITLPKYEFDESIIDEQLKGIASNYTVYQKNESIDENKLVENGDAVLLSLTAKDGDEELKNLSSQGRTYIVGQGYMPEDFDANIIGMKMGETKEFTFKAPTFDDNFEQKLSDIDAKVTILEFQNEATPSIDDDWVRANLPMYSGVDALRSEMKDGLEKQAKDEYNAMSKSIAAREIAKRFKGNIDDLAYIAMRDQMMTTLKMQVAQSGRTWEEFLDENGGEQQFTMMLMLQVRENLQQGYALDSIFEHEKLNISDSDIEQACRAVSPNANPVEVRAYFEKNGGMFSLIESAQRLKANDWLFENANITYEGDVNKGDSDES